LARTDGLGTARFRFATSDDEGTFEVGRGLGADMLDAAPAAGAKVIIAQAVALGNR
jgi:hypothetical protein